MAITDIEINVYGILSDWNCEDSGLVGIIGMELEDFSARSEVDVVGAIGYILVVKFYGIEEGGVGVVDFRVAEFDW